mmetsp:Transcript_29536/g.71015  ORF Transcript_29536/g.71015 Transcript_29536/m.71015 type:complete len:120 (-) Transcript_29536:565-924(-)
MIQPLILYGKKEMLLSNLKISHPKISEQFDTSGRGSSAYDLMPLARVHQYVAKRRIQMPEYTEACLCDCLGLTQYAKADVSLSSLTLLRAKSQSSLPSISLEIGLIPVKRQRYGRGMIS